jgi:hypothetical protein
MRRLLLLQRKNVLATSGPRGYLVLSEDGVVAGTAGC